MRACRPDRLRQRFPLIRPGAEKPVKKAAKKKAAPKPLPPLPASTLTDDTLTIVLRIPPYEISPNGRGHWRTIAKHKKAAKKTANLVTLGAIGTARPQPVGYSLAYYWPSTHRDDDNAIGSCKAILDGICAALGMDDKHLRFHALHHHADRSCPRVEIIMHLTAPTP
ncbi:hypothetical protein JIN84_12835 [Luteolibacter yonseiensis]|uniref:Uncharacterized protein n=1 Tax=Luteolibacter yonseiensis TaxID=1144680 RepID=A0A934VCH8_9BACT|nr:hypothetical protein [Luteolibacter yonseiensis]MBK1816504.1 hypothetical protein [Luteolibacter yonseiensis]